jgi:CRP-like cAMP-binding protein
VAVIAKHGEGDEKVLNTLGAGRSFGERGLMQKRPRALSVRSKTSCTLITIDADEFRNVMMKEVDTQNQMKFDFACKHIPFFEDKPKTVQDKLVYVLSMEEYGRN